jgi:hypothetical protein
MKGSNRFTNCLISTAGSENSPHQKTQSLKWAILELALMAFSPVELPLQDISQKQVNDLPFLEKQLSS